MSLQRTLQALSDVTRREILTMLKHGPKAAGDIAAQFKMSAPAVSRHLAILKDADLISDTRQGKFIIYELNTSVLEEVLLWVKSLNG